MRLVDVHRRLDRFGTLRRVVPEHRAYVPAHVHERDFIRELVVFNHVALLCTEGTEPGFQPHRGGVWVQVVKRAGLTEDRDEIL